MSFRTFAAIAALLSLLAFTDPIPNGKWNYEETSFALKGKSFEFAGIKFQLGRNFAEETGAAKAVETHALVQAF